MINSTEQPDFPETLKRWRLERALTQRDLGLPASTVAEWERGRRRPRGPEQVRRLANALALPVETVYQALGQSPPTDEPVPEGNLEAWFNAARKALLRAYRTGDTAALAASEERLKEIGPKISERVASEFLAGHAVDPLALADLGGMLFRSSQWRAANVLLEAALKTLPANSPLTTRIHSNLGMVYAALGNLECALHHDAIYLTRAIDQSDGWLAVLAHAQWIEHQMQQDPLHPDGRHHLEAMHKWNESAVEPDPFLQTWEDVAWAKIAILEDHRQRALELVRRIRDRVAKHPELHVEELSIAVVEAKIAAKYESPRKAAIQLNT
ncbi:MAG: helix-turn-helix domain-containing protein [Thermaerobacter sp.]|nr:helix-turn-helix domain-containing protein [Thermaerobacter sp.]